MRNLPFKLGSLSIVLLLAACGGGGGSSSSSSSNNTVSVPTTAVQVTSTNTNTVVKNAKSSTQTVASGSQTSNSTFGLASVTSPTVAGHSILEIASSELNRAINTKLPPASIAGTVTGYSVNCTTGSTVAAGSANSFTITANYANGNSLSPGDSLTMAYNTCTFTGTTTLNGSMAFAINSFTGTYPSYTSMAYTVTFDNLSMVDSSTSTSLSMAGGMTVSASVVGTTTTSTISGTSFSVSSTISGTTNTFALYGASGYSETYTYDSSTTNYSYVVHMTVASTEMGGSVTIATTPSLTGTGTGNPTGGSMTISGTNGSYVTLSPNPDGATVILSGTDGTTSFGPTTVNWSSL